MPNIQYFQASLRPLLVLMGVLLINPLGAQEVVLDLPHDYPPSGARLKTLADIADFQFGYASRDQFNEQEHANRYDAIVRSEFNIVTPENANKWENMHPEPDTYVFLNMDNLVSFAEENDMAVHGHPLLWHQLNPEWIEQLATESVEQAMNDHIDTVVGRYAGKIQAWDVVNEGLEDTVNGGGFRENLWFDAMGEAYIEKAFRRARAADPQAVLIYNDYDVGWLNPKSDEMYALITELLANDVPVDAVGFQMHLRTNFEEFEAFSTNMQRFADLGLDIYITELDVQIADQVVDQEALEVQYALQSDVYQETVRRCLAQPKCQALQIWGINDFYSWLPWFDPLPFDNQYNPKPAYFGLQRALSTLVVDTESYSESSGLQGSTGSLVEDTSVTLTEAAWARYESVDLRAEFSSATLRYRNSGTTSLSLSVRQDALDGAELALVDLAPTGGEFQQMQTALAVANTVSELYLVFDQGIEDVALDYLIFEDPMGEIQPLPDGETTDGTTTGGTTTDGTTTDGTTTDGTTTDGTTTDGTTTDGTTTDGTTTDGTTTDGTTTDDDGGSGALLWLLVCLGLSCVARHRSRPLSR